MWRAWRWTLLCTGLVPVAALSSLLGAWFLGGDVPDRYFYARHPVAYDVLFWSIPLVLVVLAVGAVGGVVRLVRTVAVK